MFEVLYLLLQLDVLFLWRPWMIESNACEWLSLGWPELWVLTYVLHRRELANKFLLLFLGWHWLVLWRSKTVIRHVLVVRGQFIIAFDRFKSYGRHFRLNFIVVWIYAKLLKESVRLVYGRVVFYDYNIFLFFLILAGVYLWSDFVLAYLMSNLVNATDGTCHNFTLVIDCWGHLKLKGSGNRKLILSFAPLYNRSLNYVFHRKCRCPFVKFAWTLFKRLLHASFYFWKAAFGRL